MDDQKKRWIIPPPLLRFLENCLPAFSTGFSSEKNSLLTSKIEFQVPQSVCRRGKLGFGSKKTV